MATRALATVSNSSLNNDFIAAGIDVQSCVGNSFNFNEFESLRDLQCLFFSYVKR